MGRGPLLNLAVRRAANSFTPYLVGGMSGFKKYYSFSYDYSYDSINNLGQYIQHMFNDIKEINCHAYMEAFKKAYEEANLTKDPQKQPFKYFVAFYSDKKSYNAFALKIIDTPFGWLRIDAITVKFPITTTKLWSFVLMFSQNGNNWWSSLYSRTAFNRHELKQAISWLYAPFYYNVIDDDMPDGMSEDFKKYLSPKLKQDLN